MYTIIGGDGREYGPVSADQVRGWIAGGRANLDTKIKEAGTEAWKRVADFPELSGAPTGFVPASAPPLSSPASAPVGGVAGELDISSCFERSWALLKSAFWPIVGVSFLMSVVLGASLIVRSHGLGLIGMILSGPLNGGLYLYFLRRIRGQPATLGNAFSGFGAPFIALVLCSIVVTVLVVLGFFLLIIPGVYLAVAYVFSYAVAADKGLGFWEAMETSRKAVTAQWWRVFGLMLLSGLFIILGIAALGVGVLIAIPFVTGAYAYAYEDMIGSRK